MRVDVFHGHAMNVEQIPLLKHHADLPFKFTEYTDHLGDIICERQTCAARSFRLTNKCLVL